MEMEIGASNGKGGYADNLHQKSNELILIVFRIQISRSMKLEVHQLTAQLDGYDGMEIKDTFLYFE